MADLGDFLPDARTGEENVLAHGRDVLQTTELYDQIAAAIAELKPGLVILDNIAQMFAGNENDRAHVTQFVNYLARLARDGDCAVVLLGHVAKAEGSEYSGSTAWDAAVRSRLLLAYEGQGDDKRLFLRKPKANYSENDALELEWRDGMLHAVNQFDDTPGRQARARAARRAGQPSLPRCARRRCAPAAWPPARAPGRADLRAAADRGPGPGRRVLRSGTCRRPWSACSRKAGSRPAWPSSRARNRHTKYGLGRVEWEWPAPHSGGRAETCEARHRTGALRFTVSPIGDTL